MSVMSGCHMFLNTATNHARSMHQLRIVGGIHDIVREIDEKLSKATLGGCIIS